MHHDEGESKGTESALRAYLKSGDVACPECGYNLRGVTGVSCPECGWGLKLELHSFTLARTARFGLMLACAWAVAVNVLSTFPFVDRFVREPVGKPNAWWWLTTGWPSVVCLLSLAMLVGLILTRDRHFSRTHQVRWLVGASALLGLQLVVTAALSWRWWQQTLGW